MGTTAPDDRPDVRTRVSRPRQGIVVLHVAGDLDMLTAPDLTHRIETELAGGQQVSAVVLDLSEVDFLGSAGLAALVGAQRLAEPAPVVLAGSGNKVIGRALEVTGLTDALPTYATVEQAVAALSS